MSETVIDFTAARIHNLSARYDACVKELAEEKRQAAIAKRTFAVILVKARELCRSEQEFSAWLAQEEITLTAKERHNLLRLGRRLIREGFSAPPADGTTA